MATKLNFNFCTALENVKRYFPSCVCIQKICSQGVWTDKCALSFRHTHFYDTVEKQKVLTQMIIEQIKPGLSVAEKGLLLSDSSNGAPLDLLHSALIIHELVTLEHHLLITAHNYSLCFPPGVPNSRPNASWPVNWNNEQQYVQNSSQPPLKLFGLIPIASQ